MGSLNQGNEEKMPTIHVIYDPSDLKLEIDPSLSKKKGIRHARISLPDLELDPADIEKTTAQFLRMLFPPIEEAA